MNLFGGLFDLNRDGETDGAELFIAHEFFKLVDDVSNIKNGTYDSDIDELDEDDELYEYYEGDEEENE